MAEFTPLQHALLDRVNTLYRYPLSTEWLEALKERITLSKSYLDPFLNGFYCDYLTLIALLNENVGKAQYLDYIAVQTAINDLKNQQRIKLLKEVENKMKILPQIQEFLIKEKQETGFLRKLSKLLRFRK